ncbi:SET domain protein [Niveomyces insectorum RCEF 264]|uniref:SET domain protein n=1 Tax=Niveomyces insectorum RCEF 264 TaxID=1081102 RepID=A0A162MUD2_9HYPO|nr:SET domain protein [Niveomyces insectorum RCEF 264]
MADDLEDNQTMFVQSEDNGSTGSMPPLVASPPKPIHDQPALCAGLLGTLQQAVPVDLRPSKVGTKATGLFYADVEAVPAGNTLFVVHPAAMAHESSDMDDDNGGVMPASPAARIPQVCGYCFKGCETFTEAFLGGYEHGQSVHWCSECTILAFCNTSCQMKAWRQFHKFECRLLTALQIHDPASLMFLRLLLLDQNDRIHENIVDLWNMLDKPADKPHHGPQSEDISRATLMVFQLLKSPKRDFYFVRNLLSRIMNNKVVAATADSSTLVHCFHPVLAVLNHSCEPNALAFVEGRQVHVRSLRKINPGEEITISLVDTQLDIVSRRQGLKDYTCNDYYTCNYLVAKAKKLMVTVRKETQEDRKISLIHKLVKLAESEFAAQFGDEISRPPDNYKPLPWLHMSAASLFLAADDITNALYYAAKSFMLRPRYIGPAYVADLRLFVSILHKVCKLSPDTKQYEQLFGDGHSQGKSPAFPTRFELGVFTVCCLIVFELAAVKVYGPELAFVRAVLYWGEEVKTLCHPLEPGDENFEKMAHIAQNKMVSWCFDGSPAQFYPLAVPTRVQSDEIGKLVAGLDAKRKERIKAQHEWIERHDGMGINSYEQMMKERRELDMFWQAEKRRPETSQENEQEVEAEKKRHKKRTRDTRDMMDYVPSIENLQL